MSMSTDGLPPPPSDPPPPDSRRDGALAAALVFFVLSGAGALVYQVAWQRLLALTTGVAVHSVAIITGAFMAGLGIGSHLGGLLSARLSARRSLQAFGLVEAAIAAFAAGSVPLYYDLLYLRAEWLYEGLLRATVAHFAALAVPTVLMGMSLPLLVRGLVRERAGAARTIGLLYGANSIGAAVGALLTPWVLMRFLGVQGAVLAGACGSLAAAVGALTIAWRERDAGGETARPAAAEDSPEPVDEPRRAFGVWLSLYALSGFVSLSLEMAWFRVLDVAAKGAAFTFGTLLAVYLTGFAGGTFWAASRAGRLRRPLRTFLVCQTSMVALALLASALLAWLPPHWPGLAALVEYGHRTYGPQMQAFRWPEFLAIYLALPALLFGPSTFLMGFGFPVLQRATQGDPALSGRRVGLLQAANIAGCTAGSLLTGLVLFDLIGTPGVFRGLAAVAAALAAWGFAALRQRRLALSAAALLALAVVFPGRDRLWLRFLGDAPPHDSFVEEDASSVTALTPRPGGYTMTINGRGESWLPYGWLHTVIGGVAAIAHPDPTEVAVIGLGSGDTAWAASCRPETKRTVVFEIGTNQTRVLERVMDKPRMGKLRAFFADPRVRIVAEDGRRGLHAERHRYDLIVADSIDPDLGLSVYIYSYDHYRRLETSLRPGGLVCVLARTPRIRAALQRAFPHVVAFGPDLRLASLEPIPIEPEKWLARLQQPAVVDYFGRPRVRLIAGFVEQAAPPPALPDRAEVNRDLVPLDEFAAPYPPDVTW